ncbi:hypothetical protein FDP41_007997 [Naegleria fowleri]|uniref:Uncharacterized protein n=1 Tax=Naegleria fowleri TaxID=5763 RepID=A0A6A5CAQ4_NAEFO|nr:uncharacterized protein FDP41_007997 [Naegleria fowleri]KAF0984082.1 hypothetical protein FDP41_007997 [Naegleria fowleri]
MNHLHQDLILYLFDFLIIPPRDFINVFSLNRHWRECTELNDEFWERQLCDIMYLLYESWKKQELAHCRPPIGSTNPTMMMKTTMMDSVASDSKKTRLFMLPDGPLSLDEFYRKYFFKEETMFSPKRMNNKRGGSKSTSQEIIKPLFRKILGTLNHELERWIEEKSIMVREEECTRNAITDPMPPTLNILHHHQDIMMTNRKLSIKSIFLSTFSRIKEQELWQSIKSQAQKKSTTNLNFLSSIIHCEYFKYLNEFEFHRDRIRKGLGIYNNLRMDHTISYWEFILNMKETNKRNIISLQRMVFDRAIFKAEQKNHHVMIDVLQATSNLFAKVAEHQGTETVSQEVALNTIFEGITHYLQCKVSFEKRTKFMKTLLLKLLQDCFYRHTSTHMAIYVFEQFRQYFQKTYKILFERPLHKQVCTRYDYRRKNCFSPLTIDREPQLFLLEYFLNTLYFSQEFLLKFLGHQHSREYSEKIACIYYSSSNATPTCEFLNFKNGDIHEYVTALLRCRQVYRKFGRDSHFEKDLEKQLSNTIFNDPDHEDLLLTLFHQGLISKSFTDRCVKRILFSIWDRHLYGDVDDKLATMLQETQTILSKFNTDGRLSLEMIHSPYKFLDHFDSCDLDEASQKFPKSILKTKALSEFKQVGSDDLFDANPLCLFMLNFDPKTEILLKLLNHSFFTQYWNVIVTVPKLYDMMFPQPVLVGNEILYCYRTDSYSIENRYIRLYLKKMTLKQLLNDLIEESKKKER